MDNVGHLANGRGQEEGGASGHKGPKVGVGPVIQQSNQWKANLKVECPF